MPPSWRGSSASPRFIGARTTPDYYGMGRQQTMFAPLSLRLSSLLLRPCSSPRLAGESLLAAGHVLSGEMIVCYHLMARPGVAVSDGIGPPLFLLPFWAGFLIDDWDASFECVRVPTTPVGGKQV
jgi:hypothetical protein